MTIAEKIPATKLPSTKKQLNKIKIDKTFTINCIYLYKYSSKNKVWEDGARIEPVNNIPGSR